MSLSTFSVTGFPDYKINVIGEVFSKRKFNQLRKMSICLDSCGYPTVSIYKLNKRVTCRVHRLMARTFLSSFKEDLFVNHINGVKTDNRLENLEMCTRSENALHSFELGLQKPLVGSKNPAAKLCEESVTQIRDLLKILSGNYIAKLYNVHKKTIYRIRDRLTWRDAG